MNGCQSWGALSASRPQTFSFGIRNFYVADPEGNLLEIGSTRET